MTLVLGVTAFVAITSAACAAALNSMQPASDASALAAAPPAASASSASDAANAGEPDPRVMVAKLAERLKREPKDVDGWRMLARAYTVMEQPDEALDAHRHVAALTPDDPEALVNLARAIGYANGRQLNGEAEALMNKALQKDPGNVLAHALMGKTELDRGQPGKAKVHWQQALAHLDAKHPFAEQLRKGIQVAEQADADLKAAGTSTSTATPATTATSATNRTRP